MNDLPDAGSPDQRQRILGVGLSPELGSWLERSYPDITVTLGWLADATLDDLKDVTFSLIVVEYRSTNEGFAAFLTWIRNATRLTRAPFIFCLDREVGTELAEHIVADLAAAQLLFQPIDREELARLITNSGAIGRAQQSSALTEVDPEVDAGLLAIWEEFRDSMIAGLGTVDRAIAALQDGQLTEELAQQAVVEAHKLAGTVGAGGLTEGTRQARELEYLLRRRTSLSQSELVYLGQLARSLRVELARPPPPPADANLIPDDTVSDRIPHVLIVDDDRQLGERLAAEALSRGISLEIATDIPAARQYLEALRPDIVVLDLLFSDGMTESMAFLAELAHREQPIPVLVLAGRDTFTDRVEVARLGGSGFLQKPVPPAQVIDSVASIFQRMSATEVTILAIDDDPQILTILRSLLSTPKVRVSTLSDPLRSWEMLEEMTPDLLILDVDMPHLSGIELCRVVRNDYRWATLPVVFLTAFTDPRTIQRIFAAGADDYVAKPIIGPELVSRIRNRLERTQLHRNMAETDPLTGLPNRRKANILISQYFRQAARNKEHLCLAVIDVDRFKLVNDRYGHLAGDTVLSRLGQTLLQVFRGEDVVARWGGEEFLVAMYGSTRENGIHRMADVLDTVRQQDFGGGGGVTFNVTFSGGIAAYPEDGSTLQLVFREADAALYTAKNRGKNRLAAAIRDVNQNPAETLDILGIGDDPEFDQPFLQALETRAYETKWVRDVDTALAVLGYLPPPSHPAVIVLHISNPSHDELSALRQVVQKDLGRCRAILVLDPTMEPGLNTPPQIGLVRRIAPPFTIPKLMQHIRRALENQVLP